MYLQTTEMAKPWNLFTEEIKDQQPNQMLAFRDPFSIPINGKISADDAVAYATHIMFLFFEIGNKAARFPKRQIPSLEISFSM